MTTTNRWRLTNGQIEMRLCDVCLQPYHEGHVNCSCPQNHPEPCNRPTYPTLTQQRDSLLGALKVIAAMAIAAVEKGDE